MLTMNCTVELDLRFCPCAIGTDGKIDGRTDTWIDAWMVKRRKSQWEKRVNR